MVVQAGQAGLDEMAKALTNRERLATGSPRLFAVTGGIRSWRVVTVPPGGVPKPNDERYYGEVTMQFAEGLGARLEEWGASGSAM